MISPPHHDYANLTALADGRISGRASEWPNLRVEARLALEEIHELRAVVTRREWLSALGGTVLVFAAALVSVWLVVFAVQLVWKP